MPGSLEFVEVEACRRKCFFAAVILDLRRVRSIPIGTLWVGVEEKVLQDEEEQEEDRGLTQN